MVLLNEKDRENFSSDAEWIQAVIDENPEQEVYLPAGIYRIDKTVTIGGGTSLRMDKAAILIAVQEMDFVLEYVGEPSYRFEKASKEFGHDILDFNRSVIGGTIDGNGLAACMRLTKYRHFTLQNTVFLNGKKYGLKVENTGYELIANNLYFRCTMSGLHGNVAVYTEGGDSHYTDIIVVDYTIGFDLHGLEGGSNRLTRCHVWGGPLPPLEEGGNREMLENSIGFRVESWTSILRDCYADTCKIGFDVYHHCSLLGCSFMNNTNFKLDDTIVIRHHTKDPLTVEGGRFEHKEKNSTLIAGEMENIQWGLNILCGFEEPFKK